MARDFRDRTGDFRSEGNRDRWRDEDRQRSSWRSGGQGTSEREDERGFFQRAGDEVRSWFSDEDDERRYGRDVERGRASGWAGDRDRDRDFERGSFRSSWDRDRERNYGRFGRGGPDTMREDRDFGQSGFGGMAQSGYARPGSFERERERGFGPSRGYGEDRSRFGQGASRADREWERGGRPQGTSESNRWQSGWDREHERPEYGYSDISETLGGFGNQRVGTSEHDYYRSWRDRQMQELDRDYDEFRREREQKFHEDFDSWRRRRQQDPSASSTSPGLGATPNAGVGTTTSSVTGTAGTGSAAGGSASGSSAMSDATDQTGTADTGTGTGSGRSGSRSRS